MLASQLNTPNPSVPAAAVTCRCCPCRCCRPPLLSTAYCCHLPPLPPPPPHTGYSLNALVDFPADDPIEVIKHLIIGSEGTLGFVSQATYNTVPGEGQCVCLCVCGHVAAVYISVSPRKER